MPCITIDWNQSASHYQWWNGMKSCTFVWFSARSDLNIQPISVCHISDERKQISDQISDLLFLNRGFCLLSYDRMNLLLSSFFCTLYTNFATGYHLHRVVIATVSCLATDTDKWIKVRHGRSCISVIVIRWGNNLYKLILQQGHTG